MAEMLLTGDDTLTSTAVTANDDATPSKRLKLDRVELSPSPSAQKEDQTYTRNLIH